MVTKFCFCCDLWYGWIVCTIIMLVFRISTILVPVVVVDNLLSAFIVLWNIAGSGFMILALNGAIKKISILMYPCIIFSTVEIILAIIVGITLSCLVHVAYIAFLVGATAICTYYRMTLYSLYELIRTSESFPSKKEYVA